MEPHEEMEKLLDLLDNMSDYLNKRQQENAGNLLSKGQNALDDVYAEDDNLPEAESKMLDVMGGIKLWLKALST